MQYEFDFSKLTLADYLVFVTATTLKDSPEKAMSMYFNVIGKAVDLNTLSITESQPVFEAFAKELSEILLLAPVWSMLCAAE